MPTVRKTSPGRVVVHNVGSFSHGDTRDVDADVSEYLVEERGDFEEVIDVASPSDEEEPESEQSEAGSEVTYDGIEDAIEVGICPWCDEEDRYDGDHVGQHASSAHPDEWDAYQEGE